MIYQGGIRDGKTSIHLLLKSSLHLETDKMKHLKQIAQNSIDLRYNLFVAQIQIAKRKS